MKKKKNNSQTDILLFFFYQRYAFYLDNIRRLCLWLARMYQFTPRIHINCMLAECTNAVNFFLTFF